MEVDAISALSKHNQFGVAEVKITKLQSGLIKALNQVARAAKFFIGLDKLRLAGFEWIKKPCKPSEVVVITLYNLGYEKEKLKLKLASTLEEEGISGDAASVYD